MEGPRPATLHRFGSVSWHWRRQRWEQKLRELFKGGPDGGGSLVRLLIGVNLACFTVMILLGMAAGQGMRPLMNPGGYLLIHAGAQYWPLVLAEGEWWRCLTYAFTHGGLIHLGFNMVVLYQIGPLIEAEIGPRHFLILYTLTALTATLAGLYWHPLAPVAGASGSLFGLIGFAVAYYHRVGTSRAHHFRNFMFRWAVIAFVFGFLIGADNAGHFGGAVGGALLGLALPQDVRRLRKIKPMFDGLALACAAAMVTSLGLLVWSWLTFRPGGGA